jgi:hypothetical protein
MSSNESNPPARAGTSPRTGRVSAGASFRDHVRSRAKPLDHVGDHRDVDRARRYGLTLQQFHALVARGACDICKRSDRRLCIDHCRASGHVRGLLCENCNFGLGCFVDDPDRIEKAAAYLQGHGAQ